MAIVDEIAEIEKKLRIGDQLPYEVIGLKERQILVISGLARRLVEGDHFDQAADIFFLLTILDPENRMYWISLAMAEQNLEHYEAASIAYYTALCLGHRKAQVYFHLAQCMYHLKQGPAARIFLNEMKDLGTPTASNQEFYDAAGKLSQLVTQELAA